MTDYRMTRAGGAIVVSIVGYTGPRLPLLEALRRTSTAHGAHETDVDLEADEENGRIELRLRLREGQGPDPSALARGLETALERFEARPV